MYLKLELIPSVTHAGFILRNYCEWKKLCIIEEIVKSQKEILKKNEENYKNVSDPILKSDCGDGTITRKTLTQYIRDCS